MFDYIIGITIGSIAAEMATSLNIYFLMPLLAMVIYTLTSVVLSTICMKSLRLSGLIEGQPDVLMESGKLYRRRLNRARLDAHACQYRSLSRAGADGRQRDNRRAAH